MKKTRILVLLLFLVFGLIGCGLNEGSAILPENVVEELQKQYPDVNIELNNNDECYVSAKSYQIDLDTAENIGKTCKINNLKYVVQMGSRFDVSVLYSDEKWYLVSVTNVPDVSSKKECEEALNSINNLMPTEDCLELYTAALYCYVAGWNKDELSNDEAFCAVKYYNEIINFGGFESTRNIENPDGSVERNAKVFYAPPYDYEDTKDELKLYYEQGIIVIDKKDYSVNIEEKKAENRDTSNGEDSAVNPADIHSYVDCGEIVQYSEITEDGDFGDVDVTEVVSERYVTIYSDGTYYYMFDYMNNMLTIAYINK